MLNAYFVNCNYNSSGILSHAVNWLRQRDRVHAPLVPVPLERGSLRQSLGKAWVPAPQHGQQTSPVAPRAVAASPGLAGFTQDGDIRLISSIISPWTEDTFCSPSSRNSAGVERFSAAGGHRGSGRKAAQNADHRRTLDTPTAPQHANGSHEVLALELCRLSPETHALPGYLADPEEAARTLGKSSPDDPEPTGGLLVLEPAASRPGAVLANVGRAHHASAGPVEGRATATATATAAAGDVQLLKRPRPAIRPLHPSVVTPTPATATPRSPPPHPAGASPIGDSPTALGPGRSPHAGPRVSLSGGALSEAIRGAATLDELADLYDSHQQRFWSGHVRAALSRMPHTRELSYTSRPVLRDPRHKWLLDSLLERFERYRLKGEYGTLELSACAWVLGKLGRCERAEMVAELARHMLALHREHELQPKEERGAQPGRTVGSLPSPLQRQQWDAQSGHTGGGSEPRYSGRGRAGAGRPGLQARAGAAEVSAAAQQATASGLNGQRLLAGGFPLGSLPGRVGPCSALDVANMALGMAKVGITDPRLWRGLVEVSEPQLSSYGTQEVANLVWGLAQAHRASLRAASTAGGDTAIWQSGAKSADRRSDDWQPWLRRFVEDSVAPLVQRTLRCFAKPELVIMAWALAALGHRDVRTQAVVAAEAVERARGLTPRGICMMVWALATMSRGPGGARGRAADGLNITEAKALVLRRPTALRRAMRGAGGALLPAAAVTVVAPAARTPPQRGARPRQQLVISELQLRGIAEAAAAQIRRFTPQGLSNLLWGLRVLGLRTTYRLLSLAVRETLFRLDSFEPLAMATLVESWEAGGLYHTRLFAAVVPAALARLWEFRPATLVRLLVAYARVEHYDRRIFAAAAAALLSPQAEGPLGGPQAADAGGDWPGSSSRLHSNSSGDSGGRVASNMLYGISGADAHHARTAQGRGPGAVPLDKLPYKDLCLLICAYGQAGVHVPRLVDELLVRMDRMSPPELPLHPRAACRLASALASLGHRPPATPRPSQHLVHLLAAGTSLPSVAAANPAAQAAINLVRRARRSILSGLGLDPGLAITGVWGLMRLGVVGPPAVMKLVRALIRRAVATAPEDLSSPAAALQSYVASGSSNPIVVSRLVAVLGHGAASAMVAAAAAQCGAAGKGQAAPGSDSDQGRAPGVKARDVGAEGWQMRAARGGEAANGGRPEVGWSDTDHQATADRAADALALGVSLARALTVVCDSLLGAHLRHLDRRVLAALAESLAAVLGCSSRARAAAEFGGGADLDKLYGYLDRCFVVVTEEALRRGVLSPAAALPQGPAMASAGRGYASRLAAKRGAATGPEHPIGLAARDVAAIVHAACDSGMLASRPLLKAPAARLVLRALVLAEATAYGCVVRSPPRLEGVQPHSRGEGPRRLRLTGRRAPKRRPHEPRCQLPVIASVDDVANLLAAASKLGLYGDPFARAFLQAVAARLAQSGLGCNPASLHSLLSANGREARDKPVEDGGGAGRDEAVEGDVIRDELHGWAVRQAARFLPWMAPGVRSQVLASIRASQDDARWAGS